MRSYPNPFSFSQFYMMAAAVVLERDWRLAVDGAVGGGGGIPA